MHAETTMYLKVHTLVGANLRWNGVEAEGTPNATEAHRNLSEPPSKMEDPITMRPLRAVNGPYKAWGNLHNLIRGSQEIH
jgi:hypothetical protein